VFTLAFEVYPLITTETAYALHFWPYAAAVELLLVSLANGLPYEGLWRARQTWLGMAPVYAQATIIALLYGPRRKPAYRVTRKHDIYSWYWREILPQLMIFLALIAASVYHIATHTSLFSADLGSLFWAGFFILGLSRIVRNSWHRLDVGRKITDAVKCLAGRSLAALKEAIGGLRSK